MLLIFSLYSQHAFLDPRRERTVREFRVKWFGFQESESSWLVAENISPDLLESWRLKHSAIDPSSANCESLNVRAIPQRFKRRIEAFKRLKLGIKVTVTSQGLPP